MVDHTFPQNDDPNDAENFGEWGGRQNISDYVEYGLNFQNVDYGNLVFDVTEGKCYTLAPDAAAATTGELRHRIDYGIHLDARGGKTLTDNAVNYVFVKPNVATDDAPEIVVNTTGTPPTDASLKIGELDTNNNTATELNRRPDVTLGDADIERLAAALDANGQDISNVGAFDSDSVSTEEAIIDGVPMDVIGADTQSGDTSISTTLSVSGIPEDDAIYVEFDLLPQSSGLLQMQIDGVATSDYAYFDESGAKVTGQSSIELFDYGSFPEISGPVRLSILSTGSKPSVVNLGSAAKIGQVNGFATKGGLSTGVSDPFSVSITSTGGLTDGDTITVKRAFQ